MKYQSLGDSGNKIIVGGSGSDSITTGSGNSLIFGDSGSIQYFTNGQIQSAQSTDPNVGGDDTITSGQWKQYVLGGFGNDLITTGAGNSIIFGDSGYIASTLHQGFESCPVCPSRPGRR